ncbi:nucleoside diphosphate kinase [Brettanomyces bruxellensis]|uniref:Nucleoside diphosphate kinase n=1 Tax=Dekkera bruxellensis TaxID=5007 RepID=A0A8H6EYD5_DEKBR|nr:nucleoside diphosphate kinase [Brettanomyces bruxellensis]
MSSQERTFIAVKPDGVQRGIFPEVLKRFTQRGFKLVGPILATVWEGKDVVKQGRAMLGATNPLNSAPGTIRGDFAIDMGRNVIHGSDSVENAKKEISLWFKPEELVDYKSTLASWIYE